MNGDEHDIEGVMAAARGGESDTRMKDVIAAQLFGELMPRVGRYELLGLLGEGAMGRVYAARDPAVDPGGPGGGKVAIKLVRSAGAEPVERGHARLRREAQMLARVAHPNVVGLLDSGVHEGEVFVVMEFVDGGTLASWLRARPRTWAQMLEPFLAAGAGLAAAHAVDVVHRDFKPKNVLIGSDGRARVVDFGLARPCASVQLGGPGRGHTVTGIGMVPGTPGFMAPELLAGDRATRRSDIYAFCAALLVELPAATPREVIASVERGVAVDPAARWPRLEPLLDRLAAARARAASGPG